MPKNEATGILGKEVTDQKGDEVGRIVNVLVDQDGNPRAVVIDFGGWLGVGSRKIAVVWRALHFAPGSAGNGRITLDMTPEQLKNTPEYTGPGEPVTVAAPPRPGEPSPEPAGPR
ncbi:MAG TPA: PRC-barrel domain-containing protein [Acetobacteraceae bacterium]|nr:PRC-barrel domain-containing protein [Acetobacteraceae bacterium]